jgi:hypothetical protein
MLAAAFLGFFAAATPTARAVMVVQVEPAVAAAARALGPEVELFTPRKRPLRTLAEIRSPGEEMGTGDLGLVRPLLPLLRAAGVKVGGGALDLMRLVSASHFSTVFAEHPRLRLFAVRRRADAAEQAVVERAGGVPLVLVARGETPPAVPAHPAPAATGPPPGKGTFLTSFGPLIDVTSGPTARVRRFDPLDGPQEETRSARPGNTLVVLHIDRDFGAGEGVVSFLFGSGTLLKAEFERLELRDGNGRRYPVTATHAEGRALELAYEVPRAARALVLIDGDRRHPLAASISPAHATAD